MMVDAKVDRTNEELYKLNAELHFCRIKMEKQTAVVAHLNSTIRTKDAELRAKDEELAKLHTNSVAVQTLQTDMKTLQGLVASLAAKLDTALAVFF